MLRSAQTLQTKISKVSIVDSWINPLFPTMYSTFRANPTENGGKIFKYHDYISLASFLICRPIKGHLIS